MHKSCTIEVLPNGNQKYMNPQKGNYNENQELEEMEIQRDIDIAYWEKLFPEKKAKIQSNGHQIFSTQEKLAHNEKDQLTNSNPFN